MSEYQNYLFKTIDKPLTTKQQREVDSWSSRAEVSSTSANFVYNYGDFPQDEEKVLEEYFDTLYYYSNWGTFRLMFRFPLESINPDKVSEFAREADTGYTTHLQLSKGKNCWILDFYWSDEPDDERWMEERFELEGLIPIREQIMRGDYRALYLFWIKLATYELEDEPIDDAEEINPPVPPNLGKLNRPLQNFVNLFDIDYDLIKAAASFENKKTREIDYKKLVLQLSEKERLDFLIRLVKGEENLVMKMNNRLKKFLENNGNTSNESRPCPIELLRKSEK